MNAQGTLDDSRRSLLEQVDGHAAAGVERLQWLTTQDVMVCPLCQERTASNSRCRRFVTSWQGTDQPT